MHELCELRVTPQQMDALRTHPSFAKSAILHLQGIYGDTNTPNYDVFLTGYRDDGTQEVYIGSISFYGCYIKSDDNKSGINLKLNITPFISLLSSQDYIHENTVILSFHAQESHPFSPPVLIEHVLLYIGMNEFH